MTECGGGEGRGPRRQRGSGGRGLLVVLVVAGVMLSGCGITKAIRAVRHTVGIVNGNRTTINGFTTSLKSGESTPFQATYVTSGSAPATIVYAVRPPTGLSFTDTPTGSGSPNVHVIINSSGEYSCTSGSGVTCEKLGTADAATENAIFGFYTPSHWVTFLHDFALAAGIAGDKVTSSTMSVNGFSMKCVDFQASGVPGTSTVCTTQQDILGYVKVAGDSTSFTITDYSASPSTSLFSLPPGAKVTTPSTSSSS